FRIWASPSFRREWGISTRGCPARSALRIRVSMSAIGSVMLISGSVLFAGDPHGLPARFDDPRDHSLQGQLPEADSAQAELAQIPSRSPAVPAAVVAADLELRLPDLLGAYGGGGQWLPPSSVLAERQSHQGEQVPRFLVRAGGGHDGDVQS